MIETPTGRYVPVDGGPSPWALSDALGQAAIPIHTAEAGQSLDLGQGAHLQALVTTRGGAVLLLEWHNFRTLLPISLDEDLCQSLLEEPEPMTVAALLLVNSGAAVLVRMNGCWPGPAAGAA